MTYRTESELSRPGYSPAHQSPRTSCAQPKTNSGIRHAGSMRNRLGARPAEGGISPAVSGATPCECTVVGTGSATASSGLFGVTSLRYEDLRRKLGTITASPSLNYVRARSTPLLSGSMRVDHCWTRQPRGRHVRVFKAARLTL